MTARPKAAKAKKPKAIKKGSALRAKGVKKVKVRTIVT